MRWRTTNLVLMEVMTILISMITMMMMPKASLEYSISYFVFYFAFHMSKKLQYAFRHDKYL